MLIISGPWRRRFPARVINIHVCVYIYIYIYIYMCILLSYIHMYIHIYIYIYILLSYIHMYNRARARTLRSLRPSPRARAIAGKGTPGRITRGEQLIRRIIRRIAITINDNSMCVYIYIYIYIV